MIVASSKPHDDDTPIDFKECRQKEYIWSICVGWLSVMFELYYRDKGETDWIRGSHFFGLSFRPLFWGWGFSSIYYDGLWWSWQFGPIQVTWYM